MYKKYLFVVLITSLAMSLAGCASSDEETETETETKTETETETDRAADVDSEETSAEGPAVEQKDATTEDTDSDMDRAVDVDSEETSAEEPAVEQKDAATEDTAADEEDYGIMTLPLYIGLSVESIDDGVAAVKIENRSGYEIEYDNAFSLEREEGDEWVTLQPEEEIAFEDVAYLLPDLEDAEVTCDLNPYGELEDGHYRIEKDDIYAEFALVDGELESVDE